MKICGIYFIENIVNGKKIVGSSSDIIKRWSRYRKELKHNKFTNPHLQLSYNKYGESNFKYYIIETCSKKDLLILEDFYMKMLNTLDRSWGYNFKPASRPTLNKESRTKISLSQIGKKHHYFGKHFSEDHKRKISESLKGRKISKETKIKLSKRHKGRKLSRERIMLSVNKRNARTEEQKTETKRKMQLALTGKKQTKKALAVRLAALKNMSEEVKKEKSRKIKEKWALRKQKQCQIKSKHISNA